MSLLISDNSGGVSGVGDGGAGGMTGTHASHSVHDTLLLVSTSSTTPTTSSTASTTSNTTSTIASTSTSQESESANLSMSTYQPKLPPHCAGERFDSGVLNLTIGPMFAKKTTRLLEALTTFADVGLKVLYINTRKDERETEGGDGHVTTHSSQFRGMSPKITKRKVLRLADVDVRAFDVIGVDECQFFPDLLVEVVKWVEVEAKIVHCAGLDGDAFKRPFGQTLSLVPYANKVKKLSAVCNHCLKRSAQPNLLVSTRRLNTVDAPFTGRLVSSDATELVGGADIYAALCRQCHQLNAAKTVVSGS